jgi:predicted CoA-binding protein
MATATMTHAERVQDFLAQKRIAVCGLSRTKDSGAGAIYLKLRDRGYQVFPVHPQAATLHGDPCYPNLSAVPGGVDAVFIMNSPDVTEKIVDEALALGIRRVWMHNNTLMPSSVSDAAVMRCREAGASVISVGCPMMFLEHPDIFHNGIRWFLKATGRFNRN